MTFRKVRIPFFLISTGTLAIIWFFNLMMSPDSFVAVKEEDQSISVNNTWKEYLEDLDRRNDVKMKENYDDLMQLGVVFTDANNFRDAAACYWWAKTIYPYLDMHESDVLPIFFEEKRMDVF